MRRRLVDAATELLRSEGHGAVTVRRVAEHAGLKRQIVHYYFRSMEELLLEVVRCAAERYLERQSAALESDEPLRKLWELTSFPQGIGLEIEFMSLANHLKSVRSLLADYMARSREVQAEAVRRQMQSRQENALVIRSPEAMSLIMRAIARTLVTEASLGVTCGHADALSVIESYLDREDSRDEDSDQRRSSG